MVKSVRIAVAAGLLAAVTEPAAAFHPVGGALFRAPGTFFKCSQIFSFENAQAKHSHARRNPNAIENDS